MTRPEAWLEKGYGLLLRLYPADFRREYGVEMTTVFRDALQDAQGNRTQAACLLREVAGLPASLVQLYRLRLEAREGKMSGSIEVQASNASLSANLGAPHPAEKWSDYLLAALPALLAGIMLSLSYLIILTGLLPENNRALNVIFNGFAIVFLVLIAGFCALAWRRGWPRWAGSWMGAATAGLAILAFYLLNLALGINNGNVNEQAGFQIIPLLLFGYLLYRIARHDRTQGLLAALPMAGLTWMIMLEFVPIGVKAAILLLTWLTIGMGAACILAFSRHGIGPGPSLALALVVNAAIGLPYAWAGIYLGGMLSSSAPGPNLAEVLKSYIPAMLGSSTFIVGPMLGWLFRDLGNKSGKLGNFSYHLALAGMLVLLAATLLGSIYLNGDTQKAFADRLVETINWLTLLGVVLLFSGSALLIRAAHQKKTITDLVRPLVLPLIALCLPSLLFLISPVYSYLISIDFGLLAIKLLPREVVFTIGMVWIAVTIWLVTGWKTERMQGD